MAVWQLRQGLEIDGPSANERIAVAAEWLVQAGPELLRRCLLERRLEEAEATSCRAGDLYTGLPGLGLERWGFGKRRLGEVRAVVGKATLASVDDAVRRMTEASMRLAKM
jgi:hypothetical protein